jgi:hypothetical protein
MDLRGKPDVRAGYRNLAASRLLVLFVSMAAYESLALGWMVETSLSAFT